MVIMIIVIAVGMLKSMARRPNTLPKGVLQIRLLSHLLLKKQPLNPFPKMVQVITAALTTNDVLAPGWFYGADI